MTYTYITKEGSDLGLPYWKVSVYKHFREPIVLKVENFKYGFKSGEGYDENQFFCDHPKFDYKTAIYASSDELYASATTIDTSKIEELKQMVIERFYKIIESQVEKKTREIEDVKKKLNDLENLKKCYIFLNGKRNEKLNQLLE
jgi:hypothetical protein